LPCRTWEVQPPPRLNPTWPPGSKPKADDETYSATCRRTENASAAPTRCRRRLLRAALLTRPCTRLGVGLHPQHILKTVEGTSNSNDTSPTWLATVVLGRWVGCWPHKGPNHPLDDPLCTRVAAVPASSQAFIYPGSPLGSSTSRGPPPAGGVLLQPPTFGCRQSCRASGRIT
jgi:hypothetical protein